MNGEKAPEAREIVETPLNKELKRLKKLLGKKPKDLFAGEWRQEGEYFEVGFEEGELKVEDLYKHMEEILEGGIENYWELCRYKQYDKLLRKLITWKAYNASENKEEREKYAQEFQLANEGLTYFTYFPESIEMVGKVMGEYDSLTQKWMSSYHLGRIPERFDELEDLSFKYLEELNDAIEKRLQLAQFNMEMNSIRLKQKLPEVDAKLEALRSDPNVDEAELLYWEHLEKLADNLGVRDATLEQLKKKRDEALEKYKPANEKERQNLLDNDEALRRKMNELDMRTIRLLSGRKEETGLKQDFIPQQIYTGLWQECNSEMRNAQESFEKEHARNEDASIGELVEHVEGLRAQHIQEGVVFTHDLGTYQLLLDELARIQNQFGVQMNTEGISGKEPQLSKKEAEELRKFLDVRAEHRMQQIRNSLEAADKMLEVTLTEKIEHGWNKEGKKFVTNLSEKLARAATSPIPSEENKSAPARLYRSMAGFLDLPVSKEEQIKELSGDIQESMGWAKGKTWEELTPEEKQKVLEKCKSVIDVKNKFDRKAIENLHQTMDLIEELPHASELMGEVVDQEYVEQVEKMIKEGKIPELPNKRIDRKIIGMNIEGITINEATAYELLFRQRRAEWGDPHEQEGFIGEYSKYMHGLEENLQLNFDVAGGLWRAQQAWQEYAGDILKATGITAGSMLLIATLAAGGGVVVWEGGKFVVRRVRGGGRAIGRVRGLRAPRAVKSTVEQLTKMRYFQRERQIAELLKKSRFGKWIDKMPALRNMKSVRAGGRVIRIGAWAAVPAITVYENHLINEQMEGTENRELIEEYKKMKTTNWLEAGGVASTLFLPSLGPAVVLAAPVVYAGKYNRERREVKMDWDRNAKDWEAQYGSADLRQAITDQNIARAIEAGGGGASQTRVENWTRTVGSWMGIGESGADDQRHVVEMIDKANIGARREIYKAYFKQNLMMPENADEDLKKQVVSDKERYIHLITGGDCRDVTNENFQNADTYAELVQLRRGLEEADESLLLSFVEEDGDRHWLDLTKLTPTTQENRATITGIVADYKTYVRPMQELILFYTEGRSTEGRGKKWDSLVQKTKGHLYSKFLHHLHDAEAAIRSHDWPGFELTGGEASSENVVRFYVAKQIQPKVESLITLLLHGKLQPEEYEHKLREIDNYLVSLQEIDDTRAYLEEASRHVKVDEVKDREDNPIYGLFVSP